MNLKWILKAIFSFDDFMKIYLIMFSILYMMGLFKFLFLIDSIKGFFSYLGLMTGMLIIVLMGLHIFQFLGRLVKMDKIYADIKSGAKNKKQ